ncbi:M20/M25/M40 family metallo-hydrolase [Natrarchaeobius halalkaliphilus]|uniref:M20/M25/M40 family metallo-hydrolase n=1 Tax=Natrarchaeobius halalkaliphilus TaxID=1679091 RepID=A0A3N6N0M1_9EURY|nr:M20 family metallopeptidase [Natrarchaeobius halalkaliphilus]RQG91452.1 M20/M25/M40 family metallo-hydrolase [Natrarchaeobius halalkaliphilus]
MGSDFDLVEFHADAVAIPSHEDVTEMRDFLLETLSDAGMAPEVDEFGNVLASRGRGDDDGTHVVLNTHIDTVPPHVSYDRDEGSDVVRGRGACDAKGPLASLLAAFLRVEPSDGRLTLAITPDEETLMTGAAGLAERLSADGYVVGEPTGLDVCVGARGQCEGTITIEGEGGHAASVPAATNPVAGLAAVLEALERYDDASGSGDTDVLGGPKLTPTGLEGGGAPNRVPGRCRLTFDRRTVPPETSESFRRDLQAYLEERVAGARTISVDLIRPDTPFPKAFVTDEDDELVRTLRAASGGDVRPFGAATEAGFFAATAPTVVFGPGVLADEDGAVAHAEREYVAVSALEAAAEALEDALSTLVTSS